MDEFIDFMGVDQLPLTAVSRVLKTYQLLSTKCTDYPQSNASVSLNKMYSHFVVHTNTPL